MPIVYPAGGSGGGGGGGSGTVTNVSSADAAITVATPTTTPVLHLATLDVIATNEPPAAAVPMNAKKITGLANGTAASDAAAFGQIPTALPPNGAAGGDLAGTYPSPTVKAVTETSGPTDLVIGAVTDGQFLKRTGATLVSGAAVTSVTAADTSLVVGGTATAPTIAAATLDVIATQHPPAADWSNNSKKITGLANAVDKASAMAYGQFGSHVTPPSAALYDNYSRVLGGQIATIALTSQTLRLVGITLPSGVLITSISFMSGGTALATGTHQLFGIYDDPAGSSSGTAYALLRGSSDDTSTAWAASTLKTLNLTSTYTTTRAGLFYIGILVVATTPPTLQGFQSASQIMGLAPVLHGTSTASVSALPNPAAAPVIGSAITYCYVS